MKQNETKQRKHDVTVQGLNLVFILVVGYPNLQIVLHPHGKEEVF